MKFIMTDYTEGFERWWKTYPGHKRKDKVKCFEKWKRFNLEPRASEVIRKLEADRQWDEHWQKGYVPLAHTYLNGGRFDDDIPKPPKADIPQVRQDAVEKHVSPIERVFSKVFLAYVRDRPMTQEQVNLAMSEKRRLLPKWTMTIAEEEDKREAYIALGKTFAAGLDQICGRNSGERIVNRMVRDV